MTDLEIKDLEELCGKATPGPWFHTGSKDQRRNSVHSDKPHRVILHTEPDDHFAGHKGERFANAAFCAAARTYLPKLLEVRREMESAAREALRIVDYTNRSRGYPTPKEWDEVVRLVKQALEKKP